MRPKRNNYFMYTICLSLRLVSLSGGPGGGRRGTPTFRGQVEQKCG